jgi:hypothetical protein
MDEYMEETVEVLDKYQGEVIIPHLNLFPKAIEYDSSRVYYSLNDSTKIIKTYKFCGEEFEISIEEDNIILSHPIWSLSGMGKTLVDAEKNLLQESKIVLEHYIDVPESKLSEDALELKKFLLHINAATR